MRIYIESTIPSYVVARPARDLLQAARQQLTRDWWDLQREKHELFTSQVVLDEIAFGKKAMAQLRLELLHSVPLLPVTDEVKELAGKVLASGLLSATAERKADSRAGMGCGQRCGTCEMTELPRALARAWRHGSRTCWP